MTDKIIKRLIGSFSQQEIEDIFELEEEQLHVVALRELRKEQREKSNERPQE